MLLTCCCCCHQVPEADIEAVTELPYLENLPKDSSSDMKVWEQPVATQQQLVLVQ